MTETEIVSPTEFGVRLPQTPSVDVAEEDDSTWDIVIRQSRGWIAVDWAELYRARELLSFLTLRDIKIRYKQTVLGVAWAILQPLLTTLIFTVFFGWFAGMPSDEVPYPIWVFAGLVPWTFFANGVAQAAQSLVSQQQLLTKIYLPRLFIPTAAIGAFLVDLAVSLGIYAVLLVIYRVVPSPGILLLPILVILTLAATLGLGYLLGALTVAYRDFRYVVPFLITMMMYLSPVIFPVSLVPSYRFQVILALNPMFGIIEAYRSSILGTPWNLTTFAISSASSLLLFVFGLFYFRKTERRFADIA